MKGEPLLEHRFRVRYVESARLHPRPAPPAKDRTRWGTATVVSSSSHEAVRDVIDGYENLGHKVLKVEAC